MTKRTDWEERAMLENDAQVALTRNWNDTVAEGTPVTVRRDDGTHEDTRTRSKAFMTGGVAVVLLEGISGGYRLDRVTLRKAASNVG